MTNKPTFLDPWPAPQHLWADPPWILSGTSITAWFEVDEAAVRNVVSPSFTSFSGDHGVFTRLRFYDIKFEPRDGTDEFKKKMSGGFKEAVIAFKGSFADVPGEFSAFMWTDDDTYIGWGREIFGWPLIRSEITLEGKSWGDSAQKNSSCRVKSADFDLSLVMEDSTAVEHPVGMGANWLTPRRVIFPSGDEPDRHDLNIVLPTIINPGNFYVHEGEVSFSADSNSIVAGLNPISKPIIHRHKDFRICVGDNVRTIQGQG
jgi:Acetoacetate decarboxylase (ADC)